MRIEEQGTGEGRGFVQNAQFYSYHTVAIDVKHVRVSYNIHNRTSQWIIIQLVQVTKVC